MMISEEVAWVTGSSTGIGAASAVALAHQGCRVAVHYNRSEDEAQEVIEKITASGGDAMRVGGDVSDAGEVERMAREVEDRYGRLDVLVNNAGSLIERRSFSEMTEDLWDRAMSVNLKSVFLCCKHGIPHLLETGGGSVINTASFVAVLGAATSQISYTASKGGVLALTRELGVEFGRRRVRVNALCPGPVDTPLLRELYSNNPSEAARRMVHVPMGRFAEAIELANAVLFLASDEASYITASTFMVDGGIGGAYVTPL